MKLKNYKHLLIKLNEKTKLKIFAELKSPKKLHIEI